MAITFRFEVKKEPSSQGKYPIFIRITKERKLKRIRTSVELNKLSDWNKDSHNGRYVRTSDRNASEKNQALADELEKARKIARELFAEDSNQSVDEIASQFKGKTTSFFDYAKAYAERLDSEGASNYKHYKSFCLKLQCFMEKTKRTDIAFSDLNPILLAEFEGYLRTSTNTNTNDESKRLNPNYIKALMVKFRVIVNKAIKEGLMSFDKYPFRNYTMPKEIAVDRKALDEDEVHKILELDIPEGGRLWDARNCYLFSMYCAGVRAGDLLQLRWTNIIEEGTRLQYVMDKNQKQRTFILIPQAKQILSYYWKENSKHTDYIFPFLDSEANYARYQDSFTMPVELKKVLKDQISSKNVQLNNNLRKLAELAGIDKHLSFHTSRHTFASIAKGKDISSKMLQEAMAHSSLAITERYMHNFKDAEMDKALNKVFVFESSDASEKALVETLKGLDKEALARVLGMVEK